VALLPLALLGCCLGFLPYNFYPARIILGGGAFVLGFALGTISIVAGAKVATALLIVWMPLLDVVWQLFCRWRRGQAISLGDRGHLHFRLQDMGWPPPRIVLLYYTITAVLGSAALLISSRLLKLGVMLVAGLFILAFLIILRRHTGDVTPTGD
jgi:UDP-N-acetylmuramyl pentapeptide phosphotransferase/UDP-N-acetylglucosamine-1-phosphate transferase